MDMPIPGRPLGELGMFLSHDEHTIRWHGVAYYQACGRLVVATLSGEAESTCVKPEGHATEIHEDMDGRTRKAFMIPRNLNDYALDEVVHIGLVRAAELFKDCEAYDPYALAELREIQESIVTRIMQELKKKEGATD